MQTYQVDEIVLMSHGGWLKAFRIVKVNIVRNEVQYTLEPVEGSSPGWVRPSS